MVIWVNWESAA